MTPIKEALPEYLISYAASDGVTTISGQFNSDGLLDVATEVIDHIVDDIPSEHDGALYDLVTPNIEGKLDDFLINLGLDSPNRSTFKHYTGEVELVVVVDRVN